MSEDVTIFSTNNTGQNKAKMKQNQERFLVRVSKNCEWEVVQ